jgi:hypothetical protein
MVLFFLHWCYSFHIGGITLSMLVVVLFLHGLVVLFTWPYYYFHIGVVVFFCVGANFLSLMLFGVQPPTLCKSKHEP